MYIYIYISRLFDYIMYFSRFIHDYINHELYIIIYIGNNIYIYTEMYICNNIIQSTLCVYTNWFKSKIWSDVDEETMVVIRSFSA